MHRTSTLFRTALVPRRLVARSHRPRAPLHRPRICAAASDPPPRWNWNPFKEDPAKQEAAEKALREAMGERKDVLAQFDDAGDDGGDGGDSGDAGWRWSWDDFREGSFRLGRLFVKWLSGVGQTFKAIFVFAFGIFCVSMVVPTLGALATFVRVLLRLEKAEDVYGPSETQPAGMQRSVLFSDDEDEAGEEVVDKRAEEPTVSEKRPPRREPRDRQKRSKSGPSSRKS